VRLREDLQETSRRSPEDLQKTSRRPREVANKGLTIIYKTEVRLREDLQKNSESPKTSGRLPGDFRL